MAFIPPGNIIPKVPGAAAAEGVHPPVDMHQVGDLVSATGKIQPRVSMQASPQVCCNVLWPPIPEGYTLP